MAANDFDVGKYVKLLKSAEYQVARKGELYPPAGAVGRIADYEVHMDGQDYYVFVPGYKGQWMYTWKEMKAITIDEALAEMNLNIGK